MKTIECPDCEGLGNDLEGWCGDHDCCDLISCFTCDGEGEIELEDEDK